MIYYFVWEHLLFHSGGKYKSLTAKKLGESTIVKFRNRLILKFFKEDKAFKCFLGYEGLYI